MSLRFRLLAIFVGLSLLGLGLFSLVVYHSSDEVRIRQEKALLDELSRLSTAQAAGQVGTVAKPRRLLSAVSLHKQGGYSVLLFDKAGKVYPEPPELLLQSFSFTEISRSTERNGHIHATGRLYIWSKQPIKGTPYTLVLVHPLAGNSLHTFSHAFGLPLLISSLLVIWIAFWAAMILARLIGNLNEQKSKLERQQKVIKEARDRAQEASKAKSNFLANVSHELRTPLNAIIGYSEMLEEDARDQGQTQVFEDLDKILIAAKHLLNLINDVLDLSKIEAGKMELVLEWTSVCNLMGEIVNTVQPLVDKNNNHLSLACPMEAGEIYTDVVKLRQLLLNLLSNATKFTKDGEVRLEIRREYVGGRKWVRFIVTDNGIGINREQIKRLFRPFEQGSCSTAREYGGTGLGLAISRHFVEMMGGSIEVESQTGKGTCFTLSIPDRIRQQGDEVVEKTENQPRLKSSAAN